MVLTVTPNAALDKTYLVEHFALDRVHRPYETRVQAGGKGVNVARAVRTLGGRALACGFAGGHTGMEVRERLAQEGVAEALTAVPGESRLCLAIVDVRSRTLTEVNETGPEISADALAAFQETYSRLLEEADAVAFSGSLPPGLPQDFYRTLILEAKSAGKRTALDTSGEALRLGLEAAPDIVKPNAVEAGQLLGRDIETVGEAVDAARELLGHGVELAAITLGRCGAVAVDAAGAWFAEPPPVDFHSAVGSGDAFLAALLLVWLAGKPLADALRAATAAGAANAATYGACMLDPSTVENLAAQVTVTPLLG